MPDRTLLVVLGTRPEAVKLGGVVKALQARGRADVQVCVTGQHRDLVDPVLDALGVGVTHRGRAFDAAPSLSAQLAHVVDEVGAVVREVRPDWVIVQGDTTSALGGALAGVQGRAAVAHVEAGLRTGSLTSPWPEEAYRRMITPLAALHFAPTPRAEGALLAEGVDPARIHMTGNPGIDALQAMVQDLDRDCARAEMAARFGWLADRRRWVLVTAHRRENQGPPLVALCRSLRAVVDAHSDAGIVWPVHPSPAVRDVVGAELGPHAGDRIRLLDPVDHRAFVHLLRRATLVVTDSGGVQEEAPWLGCPALVVRTRTERPEAVEAGAARLVGPEQVAAEVERLFGDPRALAAMSEPRALFGDGRASQRIAAALLRAPQSRT